MVDAETKEVRSVAKRLARDAAAMIRMVGHDIAKNMMRASELLVMLHQRRAVAEAVDAATTGRATLMPTQDDAILMLFHAHMRLKERGWREAIYCPKDGTEFQMIEPGSTGIFTGAYQGEWPKGSWWLYDGGDIWPAHPVLFRPFPDKAPDEVQQ